MRFAVDTGGTFTDLLVEDAAGEIRMYKAATTPADPVQGVLDALALAASDRGTTLPGLLARGELLVHGTTHAINAILTGNTARTAFLVTQGHPDILVLREGGRTGIFDFTVPYPEPYVPKALTFEVPERITADGAVRTPLDEAAVEAIAQQLAALRVEAVAVCLLWSIVNPVHELRVGAILARHLPGVPVTLSHALNPSLREYRRASSAVIDASLRPLMAGYIGGLTSRLRAAGFPGRVLMVTSQAGMVDADEVAQTPIQLVNSGPSMAPVAGRAYAEVEARARTVIVADTGGTTFDVSVVRDGRIPRTREMWIGQPFRGHMTGLPSVDVKSVGAGGGSIASVDAHGLLRVGPKSAGAVPGPVCYGKGGTEPTVTDAALVMGILDPAYFLGGAIPLDMAGAHAAIERTVARPLGLEVAPAAHAILAVATETMVQAIMAITVNQGIDPTGSVLIGGGGAAGLNMVAIGRRLGVARVVIPEVGAALSAAGALLSDLVDERRAAFYAHTRRFDMAGVNAVLAGLEARARQFLATAGKDAIDSRIRFFAEARYPDQVWEIELPLRVTRFTDAADLKLLEEDFHAEHEALFAVADPGSPVEIVGWHVQASATLREPGLPRLGHGVGDKVLDASRPVYLGASGWQETPVHRFEQVPATMSLAGPAIVESSFTTVLVEPGTRFRRDPAGSLVVTLEPFP
jgi:N-methylhydantoinase A